MDKVNSGISALMRLKKILPQSQRAIVYCALVESQLRYRDVVWDRSVADPGENLTEALHSNFGLGGCGGRGWYESWIYAIMLLSKTQ